MPADHRAKLATIKRFDQLIAYLRDEMGWPIARDSFEKVDDLFYDFTADELGIDPKTAAKIQEIKRLRPLSAKQPWGIFFIMFEPKKLPVVALRRILGRVALKKRASANSAERAAWAADDLLFISNYGDGDERQISFAHFSRAQDGHDLPTLKVLGWDNRDTALHLDAVARELTEHLAWPDDDQDAEAWRTGWRAAFTLRHREVVTTSKELSIRLAELARSIRDRAKAALTIETDRGPLKKLMKAFQGALVHDLDADGFADMYAQTIAYGLLSARIADPHRKTADDFAAHMRTNPFLRELMETFLKVGGRRGNAGGPGIDFDELGVSEVVELLDNANMEAVVGDFGDRNPQEDPVIHFYELFLKEYDAKKRMQRGVFYTPRPVVSYIVRSVDELLRSEFGLADGLADTATWGDMGRSHEDLTIPEGVSADQDFVQILDPATGTGTFLVEVIDLIHKTLVVKWRSQGHGQKKIDALWNEYVPKHLLTRLHGFELLMAPYSIAHLKIGLKLYETGYRFGSDARTRVFLTNALEPAGEGQLTLDFLPALAHETQAVSAIKRKQRFTIVIGNPPYANFGQLNKVPFVLGLLDEYKRGLSEKKLNLDDDFIKFIRFAHHSIVCSGYGAVGMITNNTFIDAPTRRAMRQSLLRAFDLVRIVDLHGNSIERETCPDGSPDENVFDIQQGVAISLFARRVRAVPPHESDVKQTDIQGSRGEKYQWLLAHAVTDGKMSPLIPFPPLWRFQPGADAGLGEYEMFDRLPDVFTVGGSGVKTDRDGLCYDLDRSQLSARMRRAFGGDLDDSFVREYRIEDSSSYDLTRRLENGRFDAEAVKECLYRLFDTRWLYYQPGFTSRPAWDVMQHFLRPNLAILAKRQARDGEYNWVFVTKSLVADGLFSIDNKGREQVFPLYLYEASLPVSGVSAEPTRRTNLRPQFCAALSRRLGIGTEGPWGLPSGLTPEDILHYAYAVFHSPVYRNRYLELLKIDFPRLPLTGNLKLFRALVRLGAELSALHLLESPKLDKPMTEFVGVRNPDVEKISWSNSTVWVDKAQTTGFRGVREDVWSFHIGGYQVCEKWLKDRKGRRLSKEDVAHYQRIVVALAETIRLMKDIDAVIEQHGGWPGAFETKEAKTTSAKVIPYRPRTLEPKQDERYVTCVPLVPLKAAAGAFSDPQHFEDDSFEWVAVESRHRLTRGMFVAQVVGKSMEPDVPDGSWCLFRAPVEGTRQGDTVLVQLRDATDPETGQRYTVKRYESEKAAKGDSWRHERITLKPINPDFEPIVLTEKDGGELQVIAELVEVLGGVS